MILLLVLSGAPAPLLLGLGIGLSVLLVGLYLLREQHRPIVVPFVELWRRTVEKRRASVPWQRLRRLLSLLLQLLLLGLLLLALADPRSDAADSKGRTLVFLVDVSPSMAAIVDPRTERTRLDDAKLRLESWVQTLGERDRALIVSLSARPQVETGFTNDRRLLGRAISALSTKHSAADVRGGLRLAREVLPRRAGAEVVLIGDGAYPELTAADASDLALSFEPVLPAQPADVARENVGISNFSARRYPDEPRRFEAQLELSSTAQASAEIEIVLSAVDTSFTRETTLEVQRALVPPAGRLVIPLEKLAGASEGVIAEIRRVDGGADWLLTDNRAQLLLLPLPPLRVLLSGPPNQFLEAALLTEPDVQASRAERTRGESTQPYDVVIHDGAVSATSPGSARLYLGVPKEEGPFPVRLGRQLKNFGFDRWKKDSPVFSAVDPYDVQVLEGHALVPDPADTVLAWSGRNPIVVMGTRPEGRFVALGFDPRQSDFYLRAAWPLFLHNVLWELAPRVSGDDGIALSPGRDWHLRTPGAGPTARITGPLGQGTQRERRLAVTEQRTTVFGELAGFYEIEQQGKSLRFFANYFDDVEARTPANPEFSVADSAEQAESSRALPRPRPFRRQEDFSPWLVLLGVALLLSFSEWWSYHRRWTV